MSLEGKRRLLAERLASVMCRLATCSGEDEGEYSGLRIRVSSPEDFKAAIALMVLDARKGSCCPSLRSLADLLAASLPPEELDRATSRGVEAGTLMSEGRSLPPGFASLVGAAGRYLRSRRLDDLLLLAARAGSEAGRPCWRDRRLLAERDRLERRMRIYGAALALSIPAAIIATILLDPLSIVPAGIAIAVLWMAIRRDGVRFASLNVEIAWSECRLTPGNIQEIVSGMPLQEAVMAAILFGRRMH